MLTNQRIVLIDPSAEDRGRLRTALESAVPTRQYRFREAPDAQRGAQLCQDDADWPVDCVVVACDVASLPDSALLTALHDELPYPRLPVVVMARTHNPQLARESLQRGAQDYIVKDSLEPTALARLIDNAVHRHALARQLLAQQQAAIASNRAKSLLIGNISHEIRTPMTAVLGLSDLLLDAEVDEDRRQLLEMIRDNGQYLVKIVNDLLDLSKIEAGMLEIRPEALSLADFVADVMRLVGVHAAESKTRLLTDVQPDVPRAIVVDPVRLRQILLNLSSNAVKFAPGGEVRVAVAVDRRADDAALVFSVSDNGCGIDPLNLQAIFEPFFQSDGGGPPRTGGTGLGLSISRQLALAMQGSLTVQSTVGKGSCFTLRIPLREASVADSDQPAAAAQQRRPVVRVLAGCHVVVAEDQRATQVLLTRIIEDAGGRVTSVADGQTLVQLLTDQPHQFDAVVTDLQMPALGGLEAAAAIRRSGCRIPILLLTAEAHAETREAATRAGCDGWVTKPIDRQEFIRKLADACQPVTRRPSRLV